MRGVKISNLCQAIHFRCLVACFMHCLFMSDAGYSGGKVVQSCRECNEHLMLHQLLLCIEAEKANQRGAESESDEFQVKDSLCT